MGIYGKIYGNSTLGGGNMAKSKEKLEEIKIRLTPEEKKIIKDAAASKGITMSKLILDSVIPTAKRELDFIEHKTIILERIEKTEGNIKFLKGTLESRRSNKKKNKIFNFARKS